MWTNKVKEKSDKNLLETGAGRKESTERVEHFLID